MRAELNLQAVLVLHMCSAYGSSSQIAAFQKTKKKSRRCWISKAKAHRCQRRGRMQRVKWIWEGSEWSINSVCTFCSPVLSYHLFSGSSTQILISFIIHFARQSGEKSLNYLDRCHYNLVVWKLTWVFSVAALGQQSHNKHSKSTIINLTPAPITPNRPLKTEVILSVLLSFWVILFLS